MLRKKLNLFIFIIVGIFLTIDIFWYLKTSNQIKSSHLQKQSIIFYKLKGESTRLLDKLLYQYILKKDDITKKHKIVYEYLKKHQDYTQVSLNAIHKLINKDSPNNLYNIYVTDKNFVIKNTTYPLDLGLNLSFAKKSFLRHHKEKTIGVSTPLFKEDVYKFFSYSDSFLDFKDSKGNLLQISYTYENIDINTIQEIIKSDSSIKDVKCYTKNLVGQPYLLSLTHIDNYSLDVKNIYQAIEEGNTILSKIQTKDMFTEYTFQNNTRLKAIYLSQKSTIPNDKVKILYYVLYDETKYLNEKKQLNIIILIITIIGLFIILFAMLYIKKLLINPIHSIQKAIESETTIKINNCKNKENELGILSNKYNDMFLQLQQNIKDKDTILQEKNKFVYDSIHEINSPLSIISTNNSLRDITEGENEYGENINSALKILNNTMEDLSFSMTQDKFEYKTETIDLKKFLISRVEYFNSIAKVSDLKIKIENQDNCLVYMSQIELIRLIDNNFSNAIKYSFPNTTITIDLIANNDSINLIFTNHGYKIKNIKDIFERYYREDTNKGGYGLGLNIVKSICDKYNIIVDLQSSKEKGTVFKYILKYHTNITP